MQQLKRAVRFVARCKFAHGREPDCRHLLLESRPEVTVPDLMFVSVRIPYVSAQLGARHAIPLNAFCAGSGLVRVQSRGYMLFRIYAENQPDWHLIAVRQSHNHIRDLARIAFQTPFDASQELEH